MNAVYYSKFSTPKDSLITFSVSFVTKEVIAGEIIRNGYPMPDSNVLVFVDEDEVVSYYFSEDEKDKMRVR